MKSQLFNRRFVLRGIGATVGLPLLESLSAMESGSISKGFQEVRKRSSPLSNEGALSPDGIPKRLGFLAMGYGVSVRNWFPEKFGSDYDLPPLVQPFESVKDDITFIQNLGVGGRSKNPHGATKGFLVGAQDNPQGGSVDIRAANRIGVDTRLQNFAYGRLSRADGHGSLPSVNEDGTLAGAYGTPLKAYEALFGSGSDSEEVARRISRNKSSLDAVLEDIKRLAKRVSYEDRERVGEYFNSVRNIEKRLHKAQQHLGRPLPEAPFAKAELGKLKIDGIFDMMLVAMQSDSTRVLTYTLATPDVISKHPHRMSHTAGAPYIPGKLGYHQQRDLKFSQSVARFLKKLKDTKEGDGQSLLDHSLIAYGSTLRSGHSFGKPPFILAGKGGGRIKQGQNLNAAGYDTANVWISMLRHVGIETEEQGQVRNGKVLKKMGFS